MTQHGLRYVARVMRQQREPRPRLPHYDHPKPCACPPCHKDQIEALSTIFRTAAEVGPAWGWTEEKMICLLRVCWAWQETGSIPKGLPAMNIPEVKP